MCICVRHAWSVFITYLHVINWGSIVQVSTSWTSLARGARSYTVHCVWVCMCLLMSFRTSNTGIPKAKIFLAHNNSQLESPIPS